MTPHSPGVLALMSREACAYMELEFVIQTHLKYEKNRVEFDPAAREKSKFWIETIQSTPRSAEAIPALMDAKEVTMNMTNDVLEVQRLDR